MRNRSRVAPTVASWSLLVLYMGDAAGKWSQLRWYRLQRLAFRLDSGRASLHQDARGRLYVNAWRRCRILEAALRETGYEVQPASNAVVRGLPAGTLRPRVSWTGLFEHELESHIPRPSTILPLPWRGLARSLLNDPELGGYALDAFPLPRRWRRLKRFMTRMDDEDASIHVDEEGRIHAVRRDRRVRYRLLEDALRAWTTAMDYGGDASRAHAHEERVPEAAAQ